MWQDKAGRWWYPGFRVVDGKTIEVQETIVAKETWDLLMNKIARLERIEIEHEKLLLKLAQARV